MIKVINSVVPKIGTNCFWPIGYKDLVWCDASLVQSGLFCVPEFREIVTSKVEYTLSDILFNSQRNRATIEDVEQMMEWFRNHNQRAYAIELFNIKQSLNELGRLDANCFIVATYDTHWPFLMFDIDGLELNYKTLGKK